MSEAPVGTGAADLGAVSALLARLRVLKSDSVEEIAQIVSAASRDLLKVAREFEFDAERTGAYSRRVYSPRDVRDAATLLVGLILGESIGTENPYARHASEQVLREVSEILDLDFDEVREAAIRSGTIERAIERMVSSPGGLTGAEQ